MIKQIKFLFNGSFEQIINKIHINIPHFTKFFDSILIL